MIFELIHLQRVTGLDVAVKYCFLLFLYQNKLNYRITEATTRRH